MLLKTERLTIRTVTGEDWKDIKEIWEDFNRSEFVKYDRPHDTEEKAVRERIAGWDKFGHGREHMFFAVCFESIVIGYIALNITENGYEMGYCFHSAYHKKGYAKESCLALFVYLKELGITRILAGTAICNIPSVALLKSLGFQQVGTEKVSFYKDEMGNAIVFEGGVFELILEK